MSYITIQNLCKKFTHGLENLRVFDSLDLKIKKGEFLVLVGPNGCGKSTLLNILSGIEKQDSGKVFLEDKIINEAKVGFVFQNYNESLFPWCSIKNNIAFAVESSGISGKKEIETLSKKYLKDVGLEKFADKYPYQLSGGMKQLVSIVRAFACQPDFFLMDEPFSALDYDNRIKTENRLLDLWSKNKKTVVFVSHDIEEAIYMADRVVVLSKRPAKVKRIFEIKLKRPRTMKTRTSKEFFDIRNKVLRSFREEL